MNAHGTSQTKKRRKGLCPTPTIADVEITRAAPPSRPVSIRSRESRVGARRCQRTNTSAAAPNASAAAGPVSLVLATRSQTRVRRAAAPSCRAMLLDTRRLSRIASAATGPCAGLRSSPSTASPKGPVLNIRRSVEPLDGKGDADLRTEAVEAGARADRAAHRFDPLARVGQAHGVAGERGVECVRSQPDPVVGDAQLDVAVVRGHG